MLLGSSRLKIFISTNRWVVLLIATASLSFGGCSQRNSSPDVSHIKVDLRTARLDLDLAAIDTSQVAAALPALSEKYPQFLNFYLDTLMGFGIYGDFEPSNPGIELGLRPFLAHKDIRGLFDTVKAHFPDTKQTDAKLTEGFRYLKYYFPAQAVPKIIYLITGLNQWSAFTVDTSIVGVGLDMFLGPQYPFYQAVQIPQYISRKCSPEYIPVNVFQALYRSRFPFEMEERTLLDMMIQRGKEQYYLAHVLPETPDTLRLGYTRQQLEWCEAHEGEIYNFFVTKDLLYDTQLQQTARYINDGPNSTGMPPDSPGNIGTWLGYRILQAYVRQHPELTLGQVLQLSDAQKLLQESKYKPR